MSNYYYCHWSVVILSTSGTLSEGKDLCLVLMMQTLRLVQTNYWAKPEVG